MLHWYPLKEQYEINNVLVWEGKKLRWRVIEDEIQLHFPGYKFLPFVSKYFTTKDDTITVYRDYTWNGSSGPAIESPYTAIASLTHDILGTEDVTGKRLCPGYFAYNGLYRDIILKQIGDYVWNIPEKDFRGKLKFNSALFITRARAWVHWAGLLLGNWVWGLATKPTKPGSEEK